MEPVSPALAGGFSTIEPPGKPGAEKSVWPLHKGDTQTQEGFYAFSSCRLITSEKITKVTNTESLPLPNYCNMFLFYLCSGDDICVGGYHVIGLLSLSPS